MELCGDVVEFAWKLEYLHSSSIHTATGKDAPAFHNFVDIERIDFISMSVPFRYHFSAIELAGFCRWREPNLMRSETHRSSFQISIPLLWHQIDNRVGRIRINFSAVRFLKAIMPCEFHYRKLKSEADS